MDALRRLAPVGDDYARLPIADAFTWADGATELAAGEWYLVAFRSTRRPGANEARLEAFDEAAHQEAAASEGFVHYLKGPAGADGCCMSFCLWTSRANARVAASKPAHVLAVSLLEEMYVDYTLEFHQVTREADGPLTFEPYRLPFHPTVGATDPAIAGHTLPPLTIRPAIS